jgi:UDP-glucose 4-epimerase
MRVLLTGGAGYIGAHVAVELLAEGHDVVVVDDLSTGYAEAVRRVEALSGRSVRLHVGDVADRRVLDPALVGVDAVIHLAAFKMVGESMERPERYFRNNLGGLATLLEAMRDAGVRRLLYSSSAAVYGPQATMPIAESAPTRPSNPYGLTKLQGEQLLDWMARQAGWAAVSLRYFNPVGAHASGRIGQPPGEAAGLVPRVLLAVAGLAPPVTVFGTDYDTPDGTGLRDYVHVTDLARAHVVALGRLEAAGHEVYNVGTGRPFSVREVLDTCAAVTGREAPHVFGPRRPGDIACAVADPSRLVAATGFAASRGLAEMVASAWRWQQENPGGYPVG